MATERTEDHTTKAPATPGSTLRVGVWTDITPRAVDVTETFGAPYVEVDPTQPSTLYLCIDERGLWKTTDGGTTWRRLGSGVPATRGNVTPYLDSPIRVEVDPRNAARLYATQGVRGVTQGFWVSEDGGEHWRRPESFSSISEETTTDVTTLAVDPTNFDHILLSSHSPWKGMKNAGFLESMDGGRTWIKQPPRPEWANGTVGLSFLFEPALRIGSAKTWLLGDQESGFWRTVNGGVSWTQVSTAVISHGGSDVYYSRAGVLYVGAEPYPLRSTDNGATFQPIVSLPKAHYYSVQGDGTTLYTQLSYTGDNFGFGRQPYMTSGEGDGVSWSRQPGEQLFANGPYVMRFDAVNGVLYSANWRAGLWALRVR